MHKKIRDILEDMSPDLCRWLFCFSHEWDTDCACCLVSIENREEYGLEDRCKCVCHERIDKIAKHLADALKDGGS